MLQPTLALIASKNFEHQESTETGGRSRVGPSEATLVQCSRLGLSEATLVRRRLDALLGAR
eukprot:4187303-Pyramimonas_sp.AAC.1